MDKEKLFSKLNSKDYNTRLENILENKDFSESVKNLLLSMLYKIEGAYRDYTIVKRVVEDKKTYIEEILDIIKEKCEKIIIVEKGSADAEDMEDEDTKFLVNKLENTIYLMHPNENLLLYTLYKLDDKQIYLDEKYNLIRNALSSLLNSGENINKIEVLRDFNGWNWNVATHEIPEISTNLVYQNLIYLLGINFIKNLLHTDEVVDYIDLIQRELTKNYAKEYADEILKQIYKISIIICTNKNGREKKRLLEEKEILQNELNRLQDKTTLLNEILTSKKVAVNRIKEIDTILNDKNLLREEYVKRNEKRADYNKIFSISHLTEILNKERRKLLLEIEENNRLMEPMYYIEIIKNLEKDLELLKDIELEEKDKERNKLIYILKLQKIFMKCFDKKTQKVNEKEEIINLLYMLRYYKLIYITKKVQIKDILELKEELNKLEENIIQKAYELKVLTTVTNEKEINNIIIKELLCTKIISLDNIYIELKQNEQQLQINIYDGDIFEKSIIIKQFEKKEIVVKFGKMVRVFN